MNSENWQAIISTIENTRILVMEWNSKTGKTKSAYIKEIRPDCFVLVVNNSEVALFESEEAAFFYWKTEFDCKPVEPIIEKPSFWARIFGKWA